MEARERAWRVERPVPVRQILGILRRGSGDPTYRTTSDGAVWRGIGAPTGPATLKVTARPADGDVVGQAWGPGAEWVLDRLPTLLGADDDPSGFEPGHKVLIDAQRRNPHWRICRTERVFEALVPAIIEQKVTGQEAFAGFRRLCHRFGERAPGAGAEIGLWVQPDAAAVRAVPSWEWLRMHVDPARSRTLMTAARYAANLERTVELGPEVADQRMRALPGIGQWTSAEVRFRALGDADAVSFGDYHVGKNIIWALTGEHVDDEDGLAELLEPWRGHRHRVQRLVELARIGRPRHGPKMAPRRHLPVS